MDAGSCLFSTTAVIDEDDLIDQVAETFCAASIILFRINSHPIHCRSGCSVRGRLCRARKRPKTVISVRKCHRRRTGPTVAIPITLLESDVGLGDEQMRFVGIVTFAAAVGCAPSLAQTSAANLLADSYREFTCIQLAQEGRAISKRGFVASGLVTRQYGNDATEKAPAIIIVWPVPSTEKQSSDALALADRQMNALEQASIASQCSIRFQRPSPPKG